MHRNLDRRVEALVRIAKDRHVEELQSLLAKGMSGDYSHWRLSGDGRWTRVSLGPDGEPLADLQSALIEMHTKRRRKARRR
jgi:polyphosphate kinase